jgi:C-terminal processing protease CtpA/Prc
VIPESPAGEAGLIQGDRINAINGRPASELGIDQVDRLLKQEGEEVTLDIRRGAQSLQLGLKLRRLI